MLHMKDKTMRFMINYKPLWYLTKCAINKKWDTIKYNFGPGRYAINTHAYLFSFKFFLFLFSYSILSFLLSLFLLLSCEFCGLLFGYSFSFLFLNLFFLTSLLFLYSLLQTLLRDNKYSQCMRITTAYPAFIFFQLHSYIWFKRHSFSCQLGPAPQLAMLLQGFIFSQFT